MFASLLAASFNAFLRIAVNRNVPFSGIDLTSFKEIGTGFAEIHFLSTLRGGKIQRM